MSIPDDEIALKMLPLVKFFPGFKIRGSSFQFFLRHPADAIPAAIQRAVRRFVIVFIQALTFYLE